MFVMGLTGLLVVASFVGGDQGTGISDQFGGVTESPKTVAVVAQSVEQQPTKARSSTDFAAAPPVECLQQPDPTFRPAPGDPDANHNPDEGSWYRWTCTGDVGSLDMALIPNTGVEKWIPNQRPVAPVAVAQRAVKLIHLADPAPSMSPGLDLPQWVNFPTFLWVDRAAWRPISATASVPGVAVTATATPVALTWEMGDGTRVACSGPGTPFTATTPAAAASPDCGHVYRRASDNEPGGRYKVTVTEKWRVSWAGAGQSGTLPDLTASHSIAVRVVESQALVTSAR